MKTAFVKSFSMSAFYKSKARNPKTEAQIKSIVASCNGTTDENGAAYEEERYVDCSFPSREDAERACKLLYRVICCEVHEPFLLLPEMPEAMYEAIREHVGAAMKTAFDTACKEAGRKADYAKLSEEVQDMFDYEAAREAAFDAVVAKAAKPKTKTKPKAKTSRKAVAA